MFHSPLQQALTAGASKSSPQGPMGLLAVGFGDAFTTTLLPQLQQRLPQLVCLGHAATATAALPLAQQLQANGTLPRWVLLHCVLADGTLGTDVVNTLQGVWGQAASPPAYLLLSGPLNAQAVAESLTLGAEVAQKRDALGLTEREKVVLLLLVEGKSNTDIANSLFISVHTAKYYVSNLLAKLGTEDRVQAAVKAVRMGMV